MSLAPVGVFGGTFDPIHFGHLRLALEVAECCGLDVVRVIPSGIPPHRDCPRASAADRLEMVRIAISGNPRLVCDSREIEKHTPSFTVETLRQLRRELGADRPICLMLGMDAFLGLDSWHAWRELFELAHLVVAQRPGFSLEERAAMMAPELRQQFERRHAPDPRALSGSPFGMVATADITLLDISSTLIRTRLGNGLDPRYLLPDAVLDYICSNRLYQEQDEY